MRFPSAAIIGALLSLSLPLQAEERTPGDDQESSKVSGVEFAEDVVLKPSDVVTPVIQATDMESFNIFLNTLTAIAAAVAAVVAAIGLNRWRQQLRGNVDFEAARRILAAVLKIRDSIKSFRNPFHAAWEIAATEAKPCEFYERELYARRWNAVVEAGEELRLAELEGEVLWGREYLDRLSPLTDCIRDLSYALEDYLKRKEGALGVDPDSPYFAQAEELVKGKVGKAAPDEFEQRVLSAVAALERYLRPKLSGKAQ